MSSLESIPSADEAPADAQPSPLAAMIRRAKPPRRTVLKGLAAGAMAAVLVPFDLALNAKQALAGPTSEYRRCQFNYSPDRTNWYSGRWACYGGWKRGPWPCNRYNRHFEGSRYRSDHAVHSYRIDTACTGWDGPRNAWRWYNSNAGAWFRCSDARTTIVWNSGERNTGLTIASCRL